MKIIGVPFNSSGHTGGVASAPRVLREAGVVAALQDRSGVRMPGVSTGPPTFSASGVLDAGDVSVGVLQPERDHQSGLRALAALTATTASVRAAVSASMGEGHLPVVLGGDCAVLLGCLRGAQDVVGDVGLLFIDGHEDAWPPRVSTTGQAADCELGLALGLHRESLPASLVELMPDLDPRAVVALGPRDAGELAEYAVPSLAGRIAFRPAGALGGDVNTAAACATEATAHILRAVQHWWLHVDLDVLSTEALSAVDYPQLGGLSWAELEALTLSALRAPGCLGITVCIYNPELDPDRLDAARIVEYLARTVPLPASPVVAR